MFSLAPAESPMSMAVEAFVRERFVLKICSVTYSDRTLFGIP